MENNEIYNNIFNFLNQPFIIGIGVSLIIGIFALIIVRELSIGKKSVKEQNKKIEKEQKENNELKDKIVNEKDKLIEEKNSFINNAKEQFVNFYKENEGFRNFVINSLNKINNKGIKELLEEYKNGKGEETKDN